MAQITVDMDHKGPESLLQGEEAYFDGSHSGCISYKILALFVYHNDIQCILRIATKEVKTKSTLDICFFWKLLNEVLSEMTDKED